MDAIDNPSYFSLPSKVHQNPRSLLFLRRWSENVKNVSATLPNSSIRKGFTNNGSLQRRNFRTLMRASSENTQSLVQGMPRPSDLAPSVSANQDPQRRHSSTGNVMHDLLHQDMIHCENMCGDDDAVFFNNDRNSQYYNTSNLPVNQILSSRRRRHSIGSFLHRDRAFGSGTDTDGKTKDGLTRRRFKRISIDRVGSKMIQDELDILLISCGESEAATVWVNYLTTCFNQISKERNKSSFKLQNIKLEDVLIPISNNNQSDKCFPDARLQILVICPVFLQKIQSNEAYENPSFSRTLQPDKILAMMLGVHEHSDYSRIKTVFSHYDQWRKMNVKDQDPTFVGDFLGVSMDILCRSQQIQEAMNMEQEHTSFSIIPKKVKLGQSKLIVLFTEPLSPEDVVKISIDKNGQRIEVIAVKRRNPYTLQFTMPSNCLQISMLVHVCIEKNGKPMGRRMVKCESKLGELDQILRSLDNPLHFMCQSLELNTNDKETLDSFLLNTFQKNVPYHFNLLNPTAPINKNYTCNEEFPTLLHFTAKYGFEKLSWQLMESPGGDQACQIRNSSYLTAADLAEKAGHVKLANVLKNYMQMTELSNVYNYLKCMSEKQKRLPENNYVIPRQLSDTYLIPPAARPVDPFATPTPNVNSPTSPIVPYYANFKPCNFSIPSVSSPTSSVSSFPSMGMENYEIPRNARPCTPRTPPTPNSPVERKFEGYLKMNSSGSESAFGSVSSFSNVDFTDYFGSLGKYNICDNLTEHHHQSSKYGSVNHLSSREKLSPDDELLEIIKDFKNNVFTIAEVEALVDSWQNRNDVQQSYRDKHEQLNKMREEYDRIQKKMKEQMKMTPFERIRRFFSRGKSKHGRKKSVSSDIISNSQIRSTSSIISLQSSSSESSDTNSICSGSRGTVDSNTNKQCDKISSQGILNKKKQNNYPEIPQPPKHVDLSANADFSEYVQPDCKACKSNNRLNRILNETIHECSEFDQAESQSILNTKSFKKEKKCKKYCSKSLRVESKRKTKTTKNKVKSAENLTCEFKNTVDCHEKYACKTEVPKTDGSVCEILCTQTIKCLSDMTELQPDESATELIAGFDKIEDVTASSAISECGTESSRKSSSLDLSSLSLNSNCTIDENGEIKCERYSLELKITADDEAETETAPPIDDNFMNICKLPEYVNTPLSAQCKYASVSS